MDTSEAVRVAGALIRLRRETLVGLQARTGIRAANLSSWLRLKPQVIAAKRAAKLLDELGVRAGALRTDVVHHWASPPDLVDVVTVLTGLSAETDGRLEAVVVYRGEDADIGPDSAVWLRIRGAAGNAYVRLVIEASMGAPPARSVAELIGGIENIVPWSPYHSPATDVVAVQQRLAAVDADVAAELDRALERAESKVDQLLDGVAEVVDQTQRATTGWHRLRRALVDAVLAGRGPDQIAQAVETLGTSDRSG